MFHVSTHEYQYVRDVFCAVLEYIHNNQLNANDPYLCQSVRDAESLGSVPPHISYDSKKLLICS